MASNKCSTSGQPGAAPIQTAAVPEPTFRSAILIGTVALAVVAAILVYGLIKGH